MQPVEARVYATKRYHELGVQFPSFGTQYKVNLIIKELRQKHQFDTLTFSAQHNGHVRVRSVELPTNTQPLMTFNIY